MQSFALQNRLVAAAPLTSAVERAEPILRVVIIYQDPLMRHWAAQMWDGVVLVIGTETIQCKSWKIGDLSDPRVFDDAAEGAAEADVLVISVRDSKEWPMSLQLWVDWWLPRRAGRKGDLVALIGVPVQPEARTGRMFEYLEGVARKARMDFLPRLRQLPQAPPTW
jgi:hypothetical protein